MDKMDRTTLAENNGQEGKKALIAFEGKVYDVSDSKRWPKGKHMNRHLSGEDLTSAMANAPHGPEVLLERFEAVAELEAGAEVEDGPNIPWPLSWVLETFPILKRHAHPVSVHFPIAAFVAAFFFSVLSLIFQVESLATTAYHMTIFGTILTPPAILTGMLTWWLYYDLYPSRGIVTKLIGGPVVIVLGIVAIWLFGAIGFGLAFTFFLLLITFIALLLGYIGGQMLIPD